MPLQQDTEFVAVGVGHVVQGEGIAGEQGGVIAQDLILLAREKRG